MGVSAVAFGCESIMNLVLVKLHLRWRKMLTLRHLRSPTRERLSLQQTAEGATRGVSWQTGGRDMGDNGIACGSSLSRWVAMDLLGR
jgi:hypothetical protein